MTLPPGWRYADDDQQSASGLPSGWRYADDQPADRPYSETHVSQGLSGINEGLARTIGLPVDLVNMGFGLGMSGVNRVAGTNLQPSDRPFMGSRQIEDWMRDTNVVLPEAEGEGRQITRRVGQEVGATLVPGAAVASRAGRPLATAGAELGYAVSGGLGGAAAQQIAPGNTFAETAGTLAGSLTPFGASTAIRSRIANQQARDQVPTVPELDEAARAQFEEAASTGRTAPQDATTNFHNQVRELASEQGIISPTGRISESYPRIRDILRTLNDYSGGPMNPRQMQAVRRTLQDAAGSMDKAESRIGSRMLRQFDAFVAPYAPQFVEGRQLYTRARQGQQLEGLSDQARLRASQYSQSGMENALRTEYRNLSRRQMRGQERGYSPEAQAAVRRIAEGDTGGNIARNIGRFAPRGPVSSAVSVGLPASVGTAIGGPIGGLLATGAVTGAAELGRKMATSSTLRAVRDAELLVRNGYPVQFVQTMPPEKLREAAALLSAQSGIPLNEE